MGNDIEIRVRVANDTAGGVASTNASLTTLKTKANEAGNKLDSLAAKAGVATLSLERLKHAADGAGDSLRDLRRRAEAAGHAMRDLNDGMTGTNNSLRTMNTRATTAHGRLGDLSDRTRTLRSDTDDLDGSMRRLTGTLGGLRGSLGTVRTSAGDSGAGGAMEKLKSAAIMLAPALIPVAASLVPIAVGAGAAGLALGVFGAAVAGQISAAKAATDAEGKYQAAIAKHGAGSKEAASAEAAYLASVEDLDPATRRSAAALTVLTDQYGKWSKSLAGDTMPVVTKGFAVLGALLPRLTPVVKGASGEMDRFMNILGGGVNSAAFEGFMDSFAKFSTGALSRANDGLVRFMRTMSGGAGSKQLTEFMAYAQRVGPQVGDTMMNLSQSLVHLVAAASETGVSMLSLINAFAQLVNAIPTSLLSNLLQVYTAFKLIKLASAGIGSASSGFTALTTRITALRTASTAAGGGVAGLRAAFASLSTGARFGVAAAGVGALVLALHELSDNKPAIQVDALSTSLNTLVSTGKVSGALSSNFDEMSQSIAMMSKGASDNKFLRMASDFGTWVGIAKGPGVSDATKNLDAWDKVMANNVRAGNPKLAAQQYELLRKAWAAGNGDMSRLDKFTTGYSDSLKDQTFEQQGAASAMGLFGAAAQAAQTKLDGQKQSADGLRSSIEALNDTNRSALGGMIGFEASVDAAAKAASENRGALSMVNGQLDLNGPKAQAAATALNDLAAKTKDAALANRESTNSWDGAMAIYERGRQQFIKSAMAMGLNRDEAKALASQIMKIPDHTAKLKMDAEDAKSGLEAFGAALKRTPNSKSVTLETLSGSAELALESFGYKVRRLPNGKVKVSAANGQALGALSSVASMLRALNGKVSNTYVRTYFQTVGRPGQTVAAAHRPDLASGGSVRGYAGGGELQHFPNGGYVQGPGSPTSDSILATFGSGAAAAVSDSEYVVQAKSVRKYGVALLDALNAGRLKVAGFAKGGKVTKAQQRAKAQAAAEHQARSDARGELTISHFGQKAGYRNSEIIGQLGSPDTTSSLVSALNSWRSTIMKATHGSTESRLLKQLDSAGKTLIKYEKNLTSVNKSLEKAKTKLDDLKSSATQLRDGVKSNVLSASNITRGAGGDAPVTVASIMAGATQSRDKAKSFADSLKALQKKGLDKGLIQDIANAGIDGGGLETAGALMSASSSEIKSLNTLRSQTSTYGKAAGTTAADAMYGAAIKSQEKLVKSLEKQQDKLEKAMAKLAHTIEKSIEKAFGKKANGGIVGGAASGGVRGGLTWVGEEGPELVRLPASSIVYPAGQSRQRAQAPWASMLNTPRGGGARTGGAAAGGSAQPIVVHQTIELDGRVIARQIFNPLRAEVRQLGGLRRAFGSMD
ncbi:phage tail protein [Streptomyces sp. NPDC006173]|uniref:phage tail protein n=1 Tax=Streptomyces sp. NPDC006173 TaxID=3155349 RepID=UPI0034073A7C